MRGGRLTARTHRDRPHMHGKRSRLVERLLAEVIHGIVPEPFCVGVAGELSDEFHPVAARDDEAELVRSNLVGVDGDDDGTHR